MKSNRLAIAALAAVIAVGAWVLVGHGETQQTPGPLPLEPLGLRGEAVFPAFEGWGPHKNGTNVLLVGYFNRNKEQLLDIPIGPNNRIEPGGPDLGQPTHFQPGRQYGVFAIQLSKDFGSKKLLWTLTANGQTSTVNLWMNPPYWIDFFKNSANGNEPPVIKFAEDGPELTGPPRGIAQTLSATVGQPATITAWARDQPAVSGSSESPSDAARGRGADAGRGNTAGRGPTGRGADAPVAIIGRQVIGGGAAAGAGRGSGPQGDIIINFAKHRGPGDVTFAENRIPLKNGKNPATVVKAETMARFSQAGEYWIRVTANDQSGDGGGGDQCCWTSAHLRVNVR